MITAAATTPSAATCTLTLTADELQYVRRGLSGLYLHAVSEGQQTTWREVTAKVDDAAMKLAAPAARRGDDETLDLAYRILGALGIEVANEPFQALVNLLAAEAQS